jgi:YfiH family protein
MVHKTSLYHCYFGNASDQIYKEAHCTSANAPLSLNPVFASVFTSLNLTDLAFLNQTHSNQGMIIDTYYPAFDRDGDFLITHEKNIGIGVVAADCVPLIFYDTKKHVIAIAHAGWRGTIEGICVQLIELMQMRYETDVLHLEVLFGPSALACCYQISADFVGKIPEMYRKQVIIAGSDERLFLDIPLLNQLQIQGLGVPSRAFNRDNQKCTLCDHRFFSHRRQKQKAGRQMTVVSLR